MNQYDAEAPEAPTQQSTQHPQQQQQQATEEEEEAADAYPWCESRAVQELEDHCFNILEVVRQLEREGEISNEEAERVRKLVGEVEERMRAEWPPTEKECDRMQRQIGRQLQAALGIWASTCGKKARRKKRKKRRGKENSAAQREAGVSEIAGSMKEGDDGNAGKEEVIIRRGRNRSEMPAWGGPAWQKREGLQRKRNDTSSAGPQETNGEK